MYVTKRSGCAQHACTQQRTTPAHSSADALRARPRARLVQQGPDGCARLVQRGDDGVAQRGEA